MNLTESSRISSLSIQTIYTPRCVNFLLFVDTFFISTSAVGLIFIIHCDNKSLFFGWSKPIKTILIEWKALEFHNVTQFITFLFVSWKLCFIVIIRYELWNCSVSLEPRKLRKKWNYFWIIYAMTWSIKFKSNSFIDNSLSRWKIINNHFEKSFRIWNFVNIFNF